MAIARNLSYSSISAGFLCGGKQQQISNTFNEETVQYQFVHQLHLKGSHNECHFHPFQSCQTSDARPYINTTMTTFRRKKEKKKLCCLYKDFERPFLFVDQSKVTQRN
jgi:hypothetical protein